MTDTKSFEALNRIASEIEPFEKAWQVAWNDFYGTDSFPNTNEETNLLAVLKSSTKSLNDVIESKIPEIASVTGNSVDTIRMGYKPGDELSVWFGTIDLPASNFLRKVAEHLSFNTTYWGDQERLKEEEAFFEKVDVSLQNVDVIEAVRLMGKGLVPKISNCEFVRHFGSLSRLEVEMFANGLLKNYDRMYKDRVSTTQAVAFVTTDANGDFVMAYWCKSAAVNRIKWVPIK
jgi:hypothetical protein